MHNNWYRILLQSNYSRMFCSTASSKKSTAKQQFPNQACIPAIFTPFPSFQQVSDWCLNMEYFFKLRRNTLVNMKGSEPRKHVFQASNSCQSCWPHAVQRKSRGRVRESWYQREERGRRLKDGLTFDRVAFSSSESGALAFPGGGLAPLWHRQLKRLRRKPLLQGFFEREMSPEPGS